MERHPDAELLVHPECGCPSACLYLLGSKALPNQRGFVLGTEVILARVRESKATTFVVATEVGLLYRLRQERPDATFSAANERAVCRYMKVTTPSSLLRSLATATEEITVDEPVASRARAALEAMLAVA